MPFSLELHPWHVTDQLIEEFKAVAQALSGHCNLLAIGECGLDNKCDTPLELQTKAFKVALQTASMYSLPLIVHCVGYWSELLLCTKEYQDVPIIVHGFRKGTQLANQLLAAGLDISLGEKFNPEVAATIPNNRLWFETDESVQDISIIRQKILSLRT